MSETTAPVLGRYKIISELGEGGFANAYRALDTLLERQVALKVLKPVWANDPNVVNRFMREARQAARLNHPNIVTIHDVGRAVEADGRLFIAMELVPGRSLQRFVAEDGPLSLERALPILEQSASALDYAHQQGLIHRDVKPANILLNESVPGTVKAVLTDFGLVRAAEQSSSASLSVGGILGTPEYIAPEIWDGQPATTASDLYGLACVVHYVLTGHDLFSGPTPMAILKRHLDGPVFPKQWPTTVPQGAVQVLQQALSRDPAKRPATASQMVAELKYSHQAAAQRHKRQRKRNSALVRKHSARPGKLSAWRVKQQNAEPKKKRTNARAWRPNAKPKKRLAPHGRKLNEKRQKNKRALRVWKLNAKQPKNKRASPAWKPNVEQRRNKHALHNWKPNAKRQKNKLAERAKTTNVKHKWLLRPARARIVLLQS